MSFVPYSSWGVGLELVFQSIAWSIILGSCQPACEGLLAMSMLSPGHSGGLTCLCNLSLSWPPFYPRVTLGCVLVGETRLLPFALVGGGEEEKGSRGSNSVIQPTPGNLGHQEEANDLIGQPTFLLGEGKPLR